MQDARLSRCRGVELLNNEEGGGCRDCRTEKSLQNSKMIGPCS